MMNVNDSLKWKINDLTDNIVESYKLSLPIVSLEDLIETLEGKVEFTNTNSNSQSIIKKMNGSVNFNIKISKFMPNETLRFQLASDIGHLFLHMGYIIDDDCWESSDNVLKKYAGEMRLQADEFARSLLMPRKTFGKVALNCLHNDKYDLKAISDYFGTPLNHTLKRGVDLGYMRN